MLRLDPKWGITAEVKDGEGYEVTVSLPRALVFGAEAPATAPATSPAVVASAVMNIGVHDNDETARTWVRSWGKEILGPEGWGKVELLGGANGK